MINAFISAGYLTYSTIAHCIKTGYLVPGILPIHRMIIKIKLTIFACVFLAVASAQAAFKTGFYFLSPELPSRSPLGSLIYLHREEFLVRTPEKFEFRSGWRGVFGQSGRIESQFAKSPSIVWQSGWKSGTLTLDEDGGRIRISDRSGKKSFGNFRARFLGSTEKNLAQSGFQPTSTLYVAHRGTALVGTNRDGLFPANTFPAFEAAFRAGYPAIELDVHLSKDGHFLVSHDADLSVSTNCRGMIAEKTARELTDCLVTRSGFVPESRIGSWRAKAYGRIPALRQVFSAYLPDKRVRALIVDIKPGDTELQAQAMLRALHGYDDYAEKIVFLQRDNQFARAIKNEAEWASTSHGLEGESGWEPLENPERARFLNENASPSEIAKLHDSISLSLGLGMGLNGIGRDLPGSISAIGRVFASIPSMLFHWNLDIAYLPWSRANLKKYANLLAQAKSQKMKLIGWTVNTAKKIRLLREKTPQIDFVLSDLPYAELARIQLLELSATMTSSQTKASDAKDPVK